METAIEYDKLIAEATEALNDLVKSEKASFEQELKKTENAQSAAPAKPATQAAAPAAQATAPAAPTTEVKKSEGSSSGSSASSAKKDENSGYENMSPEASGSSSASSSGSPSSIPAASEGSGSSSGSSGSSGSGSSESSGSSSSSGSSDGSSDSSDGSGSSGSSGSGDEDHIGQMLAELDDDRLQHLYMKAKAEVMARMHRDESPDQGQQQQPSQEQQPMAMSEKEKKEYEDKLAKANKEIESLKKACGAVLDMTEKLTRRPVKKAVTDIKYVERGGENLIKTEGMSNEELKKNINEISRDGRKLAKYTPEERQTFIDFSMNRVGRDPVVKILSK